MYVIRNAEGDYWSNDDGWTEFRNCATEFTNIEQKEFHLPIGEGVRWVEIR